MFADTGKIYPVAGKGSFLRSKDGLLCAMLLSLGYKIARPKCYQDATFLATGDRRYCFEFDGFVVLAFSCGKKLSVRQAADEIRGLKNEAGPACSELRVLREVFAEFPEDAGSRPVDTLAAIPAATEHLISYYRQLLREIKSVKKHVVTSDGFWFHADMTEQQRQAERVRLGG